MKYSGKITRIQRESDAVTLIVETSLGLRGVEVDLDVWSEILADTESVKDTALTGWLVEYDTETGDIEVSGPDA